MLDPGDPLFAPFRNSILPSFMYEDELIDEHQSGVSITREKYSERQIRQVASRRFFQPLPVMQLIVHGLGGLKKWVFHEYDEDPYPSVPHGHENGNSYPKANPYTGRVYDSYRKEITRERLSRKTRVALWGDPKFREFALKAIIWHEDHHPYHSSRVAHPRRLPKFR